MRDLAQIQVNDKLANSIVKEVDVRLSEISENAVAIGAAIYATKKYLEERSIEHIPIRRG